MTTPPEYPEDTAVEVRYPLTPEQETGPRSEWPWLPGSVLRQCGPDEWQVCVEDMAVAVRKDGSKPTPARRRTGCTTRCASATHQKSASRTRRRKPNEPPQRNPVVR
jgi:hypothetical protein